MRQRAGGFTAIDGLRAERVCADSVRDVRTQETTVRKCIDNGSECEVKERCVGAQCAVSVCT